MDDPESVGASKAALAYTKAIAAHDWKGACATRIEAERAEMARMAGTCEKGFMAAVGKQPVEMFKDLAGGEVRKRDARLAVDLLQPGQTKPAVTVIVVKQAGTWSLVDVPDDQTF